jgi:hypothetical protein
MKNQRCGVQRMAVTHYVPIVMAPVGPSPWGWWPAPQRRRQADTDSTSMRTTVQASEAGECEQASAQERDQRSAVQQQADSRQQAGAANLCVQCLRLGGTHDRNGAAQRVLNTKVWGNALLINQPDAHRMV